MKVSKSSTDEYDVAFDFVQFIKFLKDYNILSTAIAAILSDRINEVTNVFVDGLIMPFINIDRDNDGEKDIKKLEEKEIKLYGVTLQIGRVTLAIIKFIIITIVIFIIANIIKRFGTI